MNIDIYGIQESDFRCGGCIEAKRLFEEAGLPYNFKRILTRDSKGDPAYNKELLNELKSRINYTYLSLPYIFVDDTRVKISELKDFLNDRGYDVL